MNCLTKKISFDIQRGNGRSLSKNHEELEALISKVESPQHVLALTETWFRVDDEPFCYLLNNYTKCLVNFRNSKSGGVILRFCEDGILIRKLQCPLDETLTAQFRYFGKVYIIFVNHSPAKVDKMVFLEHLELFLESPGSYKCPMIICGNLNIDTLKSNTLTGKDLEI